jgi:hypothetical protein
MATLFIVMAALDPRVKPGHDDEGRTDDKSHRRPALRFDGAG